MYDLLLDLFLEKTSTIKEVEKQKEMTKKKQRKNTKTKAKIERLKNFILLEEESILNKKRTGYRKSRDKNTKKINFGGKKSVIDNALKLYDSRAIMIDAFVNNHSFHGSVERNVCLRI